MSNYNDDAAAFDAYVSQHLHDRSVYSSVIEKQRDFAHPAYKRNDATGELFRHYVDEKIMRTIQSGVKFPNVRAIDRDGDHKSAAAVRNADGTIDKGVTSFAEPNGRTATPGPHIVNGLPLIEQIPGGAVRVSVPARAPRIEKLPTKKD